MTELSSWELANKPKHKMSSNPTSRKKHVRKLISLEEVAEEKEYTKQKKRHKRHEKSNRQDNSNNKGENHRHKKDNPIKMASSSSKPHKVSNKNIIAAGTPKRDHDQKTKRKEDNSNLNHDRFTSSSTIDSKPHKKHSPDQVISNHTTDEKNRKNHHRNQKKRSYSIDIMDRKDSLVYLEEGIILTSSSSSNIYNEKEEEEEEEDEATLACCQPLSNHLQKKGLTTINTYTALTVALAFLLLYGFRRPWSVITDYSHVDKFIGLEPKIWFSIAHLIGFTCGKLCAAMFIVSFSIRQNLYLLLSVPLLCLIAWSVLGASEGNTYIAFLAMFFTGFPMAWAYPACFRLIEGRNGGDILGALLTSGYTTGSGMSKAIGSVVLSFVSEQLWMPAVTGAIYLIPTILLIFLLSAIPKPSMEEMGKNAKRKAMTKEDQIQFLKVYWPGMMMLICMELSVFVLMTYRDLFQSEIYADQNIHSNSSTYIITEIPVAIATVLAMIALSFIKSNRKSVIVQHSIFFISALIMLMTQILYQNDFISIYVWFVGIGFSTMMIYAPLTSILIDRLFGAIGITGTVTFSMNVAAAITNLGAIGVFMFKGYAKPSYSEEQTSEGYYDFFATLIYVVAGAVMCLSGLSMASWYKYFQPESNLVTPKAEQSKTAKLIKKQRTFSSSQDRDSCDIII